MRNLVFILVCTVDCSHHEGDNSVGGDGESVLMANLSCTSGKLSRDLTFNIDGLAACAISPLLQLFAFEEMSKEIEVLLERLLTSEGSTTRLPNYFNVVVEATFL